MHAPAASKQKLDVIIPARGESMMLQRVLVALLCDAAGADLKVVVVANGAGRGQLAAEAQRFYPAFAAEGHRLCVLQSPLDGKAAALNLGDEERRGCGVLYLDADTVILPGTIDAIIAALATDRPRLAAPPPVLVRPGAWLARGFARTWMRSPAIADDVFGGGCYAANSEGRERWGRFPDLAADDLFVRSRFGSDERFQCSAGGFLLTLPEGRALVATKTRWNRGNAFLRAEVKGAAGLPRINRLAELLGRVRSLPDGVALFAFLLVVLLSRLCRQRDGLPAWVPDRPSAGSPVPARRPRVTICIVTHNSEADLRACLDSIRSAWAELDVRIVDNASGDNSVAVALAHHSSPKVATNDANAGFAAAVNASVADSGADFILLLNPDARLRGDTIDHLLASALHRSAGSLVGGRMLCEQGKPDPTSCLAQPSIAQALSFATLVARVPLVGRLDPDALGGWKRDDVREVPALTAGLLLIETGLWRRLGGFDERYFLYGEDIDLCRRAARLGVKPLFTPTAVYTHRGGGSSADPAARTITILRGKITLYRLSLSPVGASIGQVLLLFGVLVRAALEVATSRQPVWRTAWNERGEWRSGWGAAATASARSPPS